MQFPPHIKHWYWMSLRKHENVLNTQIKCFWLQLEKLGIVGINKKSGTIFEAVFKPMLHKQQYSLYNRQGNLLENAFVFV